MPADTGLCFFAKRLEEGPYRWPKARRQVKSCVGAKPCRRATSHTVPAPE
jgi:hypothetical protein